MGIASETYHETFTVNSGNTVTLNNTPDKIIAVIRERSFIYDYAFSGAVVAINEGGDFGVYLDNEKITVIYAVDS